MRDLTKGIARNITFKEYIKLDKATLWYLDKSIRVHMYNHLCRRFTQGVTVVTTVKILYCV